MDRKQEIESHIKFAKENREYFDNKIIAYEKELQELDQLTSFNRSLFAKEVRIAGCYFTCLLEQTDNVNAETLQKIDATLAMIDLANWCNAQFETKKDFGFPYYIVMEKQEDELFFKSKNTDYRLSFVNFNSKQSVELAISEINKSPELTKIAKIFLGVTK